jgi:hypothetical protein
MNKNEFLKRATAKNIKEMRGHDAPSFEWDIYFDNVKICNCWDDSYGGELDIRNYLKVNTIQSLYKKIDKKSLWDEEYKWTTTLELLMYEIKNIALIKKDEKKGVLVGSPTNYQIIGFKTSIPTSFKKWDDVKEEYQKIINDAKMKKREILNKGYLMTWGLSV